MCIIHTFLMAWGRGYNSLRGQRPAAATGVAQFDYLRRIRLAAAQAALQSGRNVTQAAAMAGFRSDTQLRRAWHQFGLEGTPPAANRSLFN